MRYRYAVVLAIVTLVPAGSVFASADREIVDPQALSMLESKAERAALKDQCYLYAQLMHGMTELASRQLAIGEVNEAAASLASVEHYASLLDSGLARDTKKVKDAEILMRQTALRLRGAWDAAAIEDRPTVEHTLHELDKLESRLMTHVFEK